jgi:hypothetical protein
MTLDLLSALDPYEQGEVGQRTGQALHTLLAAADNAWITVGDGLEEPLIQSHP